MSDIIQRKIHNVVLIIASLRQSIEELIHMVSTEKQEEPSSLTTFSELDDFILLQLLYRFPASFEMKGHSQNDRTIAWKEVVRIFNADTYREANTMNYYALNTRKELFKKWAKKYRDTSNYSFIGKRAQFLLETKRSDAPVSRSSTRVTRSARRRSSVLSRGSVGRKRDGLGDIREVVEDTEVDLVDNNE